MTLYYFGGSRDIKLIDALRKFSLCVEEGLYSYRCARKVFLDYMIYKNPSVRIVAAECLWQVMWLDKDYQKLKNDIGLLCNKEENKSVKATLEYMMRIL